MLYIDIFRENQLFISFKYINKHYKKPDAYLIKPYIKEDALNWSILA